MLITEMIGIIYIYNTSTVLWLTNSLWAYIHKNYNNYLIEFIISFAAFYASLVYVLCIELYRQYKNIYITVINPSNLFK